MEESCVLARAISVGDAIRGQANPIIANLPPLTQSAGERRCNISQRSEVQRKCRALRDAAGHQTAALEVARGETAPAPLVFQFVETVLAIGAIAIELAERRKLVPPRQLPAGAASYG
jgi:hypothetical protein